MAKKKAIITNAMRHLNASKIEFEAIEYDCGGEVGEAFGVKIAQLTNIPCEKSFKTLVARGDKTGIMVVCIPVACEVDLKKLAYNSGDKRVEMIHVKDLPGLTGYVRGGVSPIGMKKKYPTYIHETVNNYDKVAISAGACGCTLLLNPKDLIKECNAKTCDVIM